MKMMNFKHISQIMILIFSTILFFSCGGAEIQRATEALKQASNENKKLLQELTETKIKLAEQNTAIKYTEKELKRLNDEIKMHNEYIITLEKKVTGITSERDRLLSSSLTDQNKLALLNERLASLQKEIKELTDRKKLLEAQYIELKNSSDKELASLQQKLFKSQEELSGYKIKLMELETLKSRLLEEAKHHAEAAEKARKKSLEAEKSLLTIRTETPERIQLAGVVEEERNRARAADEARRNAESEANRIQTDINALNEKIREKENETKRLNELVEQLKKELLQQKESFDRIIEGLKNEIEQGKIKASMRGREIRMTLMDRIMFPSGSIQFTERGRFILKLLGTELKKLKYGLVFIEGHTDADRIVDWRIQRIFPTNWEFSVMRSVRVVRFFVENMGLNPEKFIACGRGEYFPVAPNDNARGKALNRRIEILISLERKIVQYPEGIPEPEN